MSGPRAGEKEGERGVRGTEGKDTSVLTEELGEWGTTTKKENSSVTNRLYFWSTPLLPTFPQLQTLPGRKVTERHTTHTTPNGSQVSAAYSDTTTNDWREGEMHGNEET